jgi:selenoprotein W-related protein
LAEELKRNVGVESELVPGSGGVFEVTADGKLIYSKKSTGRFPNPGEVTKLLKTTK